MAKRNILQPRDESWYMLDVVSSASKNTSINTEDNVAVFFTSIKIAPKTNPTPYVLVDWYCIGCCILELVFSINECGRF